MQEEVIVAGYICLDMQPEIYPETDGTRFQYVPGKLLEVGSTVCSCGGAVPNTGLALHKLGHRPRLVGKIGDDAFGGVIREMFEAVGPELGNNLLVAPGGHTANTLILNPPGLDRMFMVHAGANCGFCSADVSGGDLKGIRLFHFGYPPLLPESYRNNGDDTRKMFAAMRRHGVTTSLDMSLPDRSSPAAQVDWKAWLKNVLPEVDVFLPSYDELVFMLGQEPGKDRLAWVQDAAGQLLDMGVAVVVIKLGGDGIYVRVTTDEQRMAAMGACAPQELGGWRGREYLSPCFLVELKGATGAGDCTIAGFLSGLLRGMTAEEAGTLACAVGACNVEQADAFSGLRDFAATMERVRSGWARRPAELVTGAWRQGGNGIYFVTRQ